jgi:hypothetical protein
MIRVSPVSDTQSGGGVCAPYRGATRDTRHTHHRETLRHATRRRLAPNTINLRPGMPSDAQKPIGSTRLLARAQPSKSAKTGRSRDRGQITACPTAYAIVAIRADFPCSVGGFGILLAVRLWSYSGKPVGAALISPRARAQDCQA